MHEPVHLDIPVFHIGAGLAQLPLGSLWGQGQWGMGQSHHPRQAVLTFSCSQAPWNLTKAIDHLPRKTCVCS